MMYGVVASLSVPGSLRLGFLAVREGLHPVESALAHNQSACSLQWLTHMEEKLPALIFLTSATLFTLRILATCCGLGAHGHLLVWLALQLPNLPNLQSGHERAFKVFGAPELRTSSL